MNDLKAIVLVGPMGVGKTTIGKKLAAALGMPFVDTDNQFEKLHGKIATFFATQGEAAFRKIEEQLVNEAISSVAVVATGGGAVLSELTRDRLKQVNVVYLSTDGTHMGNRLRQGSRPLLKGGIEDWRRIYRERKPLYESVANLTVDCSGRKIKESVQDIREGLRL